MKQISTVGIVLSRTDYSEADRILTILTPDNGKVRAIAKGVRKPKSKLAGGIELFCTSDITYIVGRGSLHTIVSTRLRDSFRNIVKDINRTMLGYEILKIIGKVLEDEGGQEYYDLLESSLKILNTPGASRELAETSFLMQLMRLLGHLPNLTTDQKGKELAAGGSFQFSFDDMAFFEAKSGPYTQNHAKLLRLLAHNPAQKVKVVKGLDAYLAELAPLVRSMARQYVVTF